MWVTELIVRPGNPFDFDDGELEGLATKIRESDPSVAVTVSVETERGYGVTPVEVIELVAATTSAAGGLTAAVRALKVTVDWARDRWRRDRHQHPTAPRPRSV